MKVRNFHMVFGVIVLFAVAALCVVLGLVIWKKQKISLVHSYHYANVRERDKPAYCKQVGISLLVIAGGVALDGAAVLLRRDSLGITLMMVGIVAGLVIMHKAQKQYNGGWFG